MKTSKNSKNLARIIKQVAVSAKPVAGKNKYTCKVKNVYCF